MNQVATVFSADLVGKSLRINRPEWFEDSGFRDFLNSGEALTWHSAGDLPNEYSDVFILLDGVSGEGPDSHLIPDHIWQELLNLCERHFGNGRPDVHYIVWVSNLEP